MKNYLLIGSSRGIGEAVAKHFVGKGDRVIGVSRTRPAYGDWIQADISTPAGIQKIASELEHLIQTRG